MKDTIFYKVRLSTLVIFLINTSLFFANNTLENVGPFLSIQEDVAQQSPQKSQKQRSILDEVREEFSPHFTKSQKALFEAAALGDEDKLNEVIKRVDDINIHNNFGDSPLHWAAINDNVTVVKILLEAGARVESVNSILEQPLHVAVGYENLNVVLELLDRGADVNARTDGKRTPLHYAAASGNVMLVRTLLQKGAHANASFGDENVTALHVAAMDGHEEVIRELLKHDVDINKQDNDSWTALQCAARMGHAGVIKMLASHGAHVNSPEHNDDAPLMLALLHNHTQGALELISLGADVNSGQNHMTALHLAAQNGDLAIVRELLSRGAAVNALNHENQTPSPLMIAASHDHLEIAEELVNYGADVNKANSELLSPLHVAVIRNNIKMIALLIAAGADIHARAKNGLTPLSMTHDKDIAAILNEFAWKRDMAQLKYTVIKWVAENPVIAGATAGVTIAALGFVCCIKRLNRWVDRFSKKNRKRNAAARRGLPGAGIPPARGVGHGPDSALAAETVAALKREEDALQIRREQEIRAEDEKKKAEAQKAQEKRDEQKKKIDSLKQAIDCLRQVLKSPPLFKQQLIIDFKNALNAINTNKIQLPKELKRIIRSLIADLFSGGRINVQTLNELTDVANSINE